MHTLEEDAKTNKSSKGGKNEMDDPVYMSKKASWVDTSVVLPTFGDMQRAVDEGTFSSGEYKGPGHHHPKKSKGDKPIYATRIVTERGNVSSAPARIVTVEIDASSSVDLGNVSVAIDSSESMGEFSLTLAANNRSVAIFEQFYGVPSRVHMHNTLQSASLCVQRVSLGIGSYSDDEKTHDRDRKKVSVMMTWPACDLFVYCSPFLNLCITHLLFRVSFTASEEQREK